MRIHVRAGSLARTILKSIALTGMLLVAATNPHFAKNLWIVLEKEHKKKQWRQIYRSLHHLSNRGLITMRLRPDNTFEVKVTRQGKDVIRKIDIEELTLPHPPIWDEKWRIIIFDIPNEKSQNRLAFTEKLKKLGFKMVQKSVWIYPYNCYEELMVLRKFYDIEYQVTYLETVHHEDEDRWRRKFNLPLSHKEFNPSSI